MCTYTTSSLSFWLGTDEAVDQEAASVIRHFADSLTIDGATAQIGVPPDRVGNLIPLTGAVGAELWGGDKALAFSAWGAANNNLHWDRFLDQMAGTDRIDPDRVQFLIRVTATPTPVYT